VTTGAGEMVADGSAIIRRIWERDPDLWKPGDAAHARVIRNRLGWLDSPVTMRERAAELSTLATEVRQADFRDCVLLGMGGSSLCPEVLRASFGSAPGFPTLHVLDTTDPDAITELARHLDDSRTLFLVASKSGKTLETLSHLAHFWAALTRVGVTAPGSHFVAVTDPGTPLAATARERGFRHVFENPPDIGGRYSALSYFGLVPAAVMGIDVARLLDRALEMRDRCSASTAPQRNPGLALGTQMSAHHAEGRDKVTILAPPRIAAFSLWAEQLIAESTGKEGKGYIPIGAEPLGAPRVYGDDRLFVALRLPDEAVDTSGLEAAGQPVVHLDLTDLHDLGAEFFRWELATAVAAIPLGIDPFDEPNVQESKDNTNRVLAELEKNGSFPTHPATVSADGVHVYTRLTAASPAAALLAYLADVKPGDYVGLMAYVDPTTENEEALQALRVAIRDRHRVATTLGFGPRFLHSTGQLHKGGPATGRYIQITTTEGSDADIPGQPFGFGVLLRAQAQGDLESLRAHGRPVIRIHMEHDLAGSLHRLTEAVRRATVEPVG
jgi:glucose-6-phosphate isomerase